MSRLRPGGRKRTLAFESDCQVVPRRTASAVSYMPNTPAARSSIFGAHGMDKQTPGVDVLVVDDDVAIREVVGTILADAGYAVYEAPDGELALQCLREHSQGMVVLLDLNMPGCDGLSVLRAMAADPDLARHHRILLLTAQYGRTLPLADAHLVTRTTLGLVPKPFELDELLWAVGAAGRALGQ